MKRRTTTIIIVATSLALLGIMLTQFFWVGRALRFKSEQFDKNVNLGLKAVVNQILSVQNDSALSLAHSCSRACGSNNFNTDILNAINPQVLDSLIISEFKNLDVCKKFYYGIYHCKSKKFVMGNFSGHKNQILQSKYKISISCLYQQDQYFLGVLFPLKKGFIINRMQFYIFLSVLFMLIIVAGFYFIIYSLYRQKRLSEMKTDFVNNMTHEFKTPISTISVASEMLMKNKVYEKPDKILKYAGIIYKENARLKNQVEKVLQTAILERSKIKLKKKEIDVHKILNSLAENFSLTISARNGNLKVNTNAARSIIVADKSHLINIIHNLLDNANKYSPDAPEIFISTWNISEGICISIEDKGIGMASEQLKLIFRKFHRIHTGNIHDIKGFGLGLFYVKTIVESHRGKIKVESEPGKGSKFVLFFPFNSLQK